MEGRFQGIFPSSSLTKLHCLSIASLTSYNKLLQLFHGIQCEGSVFFNYELSIKLKGNASDESLGQITVNVNSDDLVSCVLFNFCFILWVFLAFYFDVSF